MLSTVVLRFTSFRSCRPLVPLLCLLFLAAASSVDFAEGQTPEPWALRWLPIPERTDEAAVKELFAALDVILKAGSETLKGGAFVAGKGLIGVYSTADAFAAAEQVAGKLGNTIETRCFELRDELSWESAKAVLAQAGAKDLRRQGTRFVVQGLGRSLYAAERELVVQELIQDPRAPVCETLRLYYLRKPKTVGGLLTAVKDTVAPTAKVGAAEADTDVPCVLLSGPAEEVEELKRIIATLDVPQPQVKLHIWVFQISGRSRDDVQRRAAEATRLVEELQEDCRLSVTAIRWMVGGRYSPDYLPASQAGPEAGPSTGEILARALTKAPVVPSGITDSEWKDAVSESQDPEARRQDVEMALPAELSRLLKDPVYRRSANEAITSYRADLATARADPRLVPPNRLRDHLVSAQAALSRAEAALASALITQQVEPVVESIRALTDIQPGSGLASVTHTSAVVISGSTLTLTGAAMSYTDVTQPGKVDSTALTGANTLAEGLGPMLGASGTGAALQALSLAMETTPATKTWEALRDGVQVTATPTVLKGGQAAELVLKVTVSHNDPGDSAEATSVQNPLARVAKHETDTVLFAVSGQPFAFSSMAIRTTIPRPDRVLPVLGYIPLLGRMFRLPRRPVTMYHESVMLVLPFIDDTMPQVAAKLAGGD